MGLLNPTRISFRKRDVVILLPSILRGRVFDMDTIDLPVICLLQRLVWPSWYSSSYYRPYLSHSLLWMVSSIILGIVMGFIFSPWTRLVIPLDELLKFSPLDQLFYLLFQISALISIIAVILMKTAVLLWVMLPWGCAQRLRPFQP